MQEQEVQRKQIPLRIRLRPSSVEQANGQKQAPALAALTAPCASQKQIKELLRLSNLLRADLSLSEVLHRIAASTSACTGFRILVVCLIEEGEKQTRPVAFAGISEDAERLIRANPITIEANAYLDASRISHESKLFYFS